MSATSRLGSLKRVYAWTMQGIGHRLEHAGRLAEPPPRQRRRRHWAYSLVLVHDSRAMIRLDVPWWTYDAIDAVEAWLAARPEPARVFEYGSGASTLWLAGRAGEVHSVEHHAGFAELMRPEVADLSHVSLRVAEPVASRAPQVPSHKEGHADLDFASYVAAINEVPGTFDLVVVDGRAREACLMAAVPRLARDGMIVFDNSRRRRYRRAIDGSGLREQVLRGLTPTLPYPEQTSLLTPR